jgi:hypothetical protein
MPDDSLPGLPCTNPHFVRGGLGKELPPVGSHWGFWAEAVSQQGHQLGYWTRLETPKQYTRKDPLTVVTPTGVRFKSPA